MQLAISDYMKNSCVTMLNSFLQEEKLGKYRFDSLSYRNLRQSFVDYTNASVNLYYAILFSDEPRVRAAYRALEDGVDIFDKVQERILESYKGGVFSSRHITRPEATHPLVIGGSVAQTAIFGPANLDIIIGLPAGSTELAFAHKFGQQVLNGRVPELLLFPVSFHSSKNEFDNATDVQNSILRWVAHHKERIEKKRILIVDDNSSTGRTIEAVKSALDRVGPKEVFVSISEADIVRSELDRNNPCRSLVASKAAYNHSIHVLPISRSLRKKTDLKELTEIRKMETCTRSRYLADGNSFSEKVIGKVYLDLIRNPTERVLEEVDPDQTIRKFQKTALSNFAPVEIVYQGEKFNSVEHAYQAMKFLSTTWSEVSDKHIEFINKKLEDTGESVTRADLPHIFSKQSMSPGASKKVANFLRRLNYVRSDWDDVKVPIMIDLLVQKFSTSEYYNVLKGTGEKYLIEGNTWDDTFWGECNGRGRNFLGRSLMCLRSHTSEVLSTEAERIREKLIAF
ncbi:MAG: NADAR domain-containing protein [Qipengyuania citrea]|uniref:NADAR domain-containing protein n=2 Tax=Qipengyuania citrea TaxID=225971 RepID=UPI003298B21A